MATKNNTDGYGTFGNLSKTYDEIRPTMPEAVVDDFFGHLPLKNPKVLDVGCGTGIITRQLTGRGAILYGTDFDSRMIEQAKQHKNEQIDYLVAPTEKLPLPDSNFDAVTAFSSFHWFANMRALSEIKRVLENDGIFFVANRNQVGDIRKEYLSILKSFAGKSLPNAKKDYKPSDLLKSAGFSDVSEKIFPIIEDLSIDQALSYVQSTSLWNLVPDERKDQAMFALKSFFENRSSNGIIKRLIEIRVVSGKRTEI